MQQKEWGSNFFAGNFNACTFSPHRSSVLTELLIQMNSSALTTNSLSQSRKHTSKSSNNTRNSAVSVGLSSTNIKKRNFKTVGFLFYLISSELQGQISFKSLPVSESTSQSIYWGSYLSTTIYTYISSIIYNARGVVAEHHTSQHLFDQSTWRVHVCQWTTAIYKNAKTFCPSCNGLYVMV